MEEARESMGYGRIGRRTTVACTAHSLRKEVVERVYKAERGIELGYGLRRNGRVERGGNGGKVAPVHRQERHNGRLLIVTPRESRSRAITTRKTKKTETREQGTLTARQGRTKVR